MPNPEKTFDHPEDREAVERFDSEGGAMQGVVIPQEEKKDEDKDSSQNAKKKKLPQKNR